MAPLVLDEAQLRSCLGIDDRSLDCVEAAFTWLAEGRVSMPPVLHFDIGEFGDVDVKGAYVRGEDAFAIKIGTGFFGNSALGLPNCGGIVVVLDARNGLFRGVFFDNGYLTDLRTGLAGAVAARHLALQNVETVGVVGTGAQARYQIECLALVREFDRLLVAGRDPGRVRIYCDEMAERLGVTATPAGSVEALVRGSQIVVTTTQSTKALIEAGWLHPGLHITAMGSDLPGKQEIDPQALARADLVVCDSLAQCLIGGELQHAGAAGVEIAATELGEITSGRSRGRTSDTQITICDLTGTGVQDTAIALEAYRQAVAQGLAATINEPIH